jgi:dUTP pyrophosphatase
MNDIKVFCKRLHKDAVLPEYKFIGDSGCDLFSIEDVTLKPGDIKLVGTGIAVQLPEKAMEAQIRPRSGLAKDYGITVLNSPGTVDSIYTGEVKVILINLGKQTVTIKKGDRFAQMVFTFVYRGHFIEVDDLDNTDRGIGGFGHTGIR